MIRISVEVGRGAAHYRVAVQAENLERTLEIVGRQNPGRGSVLSGGRPALILSVSRQRLEAHVLSAVV
jgi:hypothetical protein